MSIVLGDWKCNRVRKTRNTSTKL